MWQLGFLWGLIPDSILRLFVDAVFIVGVVSTIISFFFLRFFPWINQYKTIAQIVSVVILTCGVYFKGGFDTEMKWRDRVADLEEQVKIAEAKSAEKNVEIQEKIVYKTKKIKEIQVVNRDRIVEKRVEIDKDCVVAPEAIEIHNAAAKNVISEPLK